MASSSPCMAGKDKYEVFISFSGEDVRDKFVSHLHRALISKQIQAFTDYNLERGQDINESLLQIIEGSGLSVIIFSPNYPRSEWCLGELEKINESRKQKNQIVVPVFYEVDPSDVQELNGNYAIQSLSWRNALVEISNLSGFVSKDISNDAKLIEKIVADVDKKLTEICPMVSHEDGSFEIGSNIKHVVKLLRLDSTNDVRMVGIWGMGGLGKTTLAHKVFDKIQKSFGGHCLVANVKDKLSKDGLEKVTEEIIQELFKDKNTSTRLASSVSDANRRRLIRMKVLLVLDDVQTCMQLNSLLQSCGCDSFSPGSRIIVTSRDSQVLRSVPLECDIFEVKQLENDEALRLFSWHAFRQNKPQQGYEEISEAAVRYAKGVPLALVVLGSELRGKEIELWENALEKFNKISPPTLQKVLKISFDGLDREHKNIFLDIACFFSYCSRKDLEYILECFGFHAKVGIDGLIDKSLVKDDGGWIDMHDLLEQMGKEIIAEEKQSKGQQSRMWDIDDIKEAFANNAGYAYVEGIQLHHYQEGEIEIGREAFIGMHKLRFLDFDNRKINCPMGLEFLPSSIKYLRWQYYPLKYLPSNYIADKLVVLRMDESQLKEINWTKPLMNLKRIFLRKSQSLIRISGLALVRNLEQLILYGCENLVEIGSSLGMLNKLIRLDVDYCTSLSRLPELPSSIQELSLSYCQKLESLPSSISRLSSLETISLLYHWNLRQLPEDFGNLKSLKELDASYTGLIELPQSIQNMQNLRKLQLYECQDLIKLPENIGNLEALEELDASYTDLRELPSSIQNLNKLIKLNLVGCKRLQYIPALPPNLKLLFAASLSNEMSSSIIKQYFSDMHSQPTKVHQLCVSGSEMPDWITCRNECGSSVPLDLETLGDSVNFIFCVVYSSFVPPDPKTYQIKEVLQFSETEYCDDIFGHNEPPEHVTAHDSEKEEQNTDLDFEQEEQDNDLDSKEEEHDIDLDPEQEEQVNDLDSDVVEEMYVDFEEEERNTEQDTEYYVVLWNGNRDCKFVREVSFQITCSESAVNGKIIKCGVCPITNNRNHRTKENTSKHRRGSKSRT